MNTQKIHDRRQYVEQARNSFPGVHGEGRPPLSRRSNRYEDPDGEGEVRGFFKLRLVLSVLLFLAFLFIQQADITYHDISAAKIVEQIRGSVSLPDSVPTLHELIGIEEQP